MNRVLYHRNCTDGFGAAWAANKFFDDDAEYIAMDYHDPLPKGIEPGDTIYMVDYSRKRSEVEALVQDCEVILLDHHKSSIEQFADFEHPNFVKVLTDQKSGAVITYQHFFPGEKVPKLLLHIQDRDLWNFELEGTSEIGAGLFSQKFDFGLWTRLAEGDLSDHVELRERGRVILDYHSVLIEKFAEEVFWMEIGGFNVPVVNVSILFSEVPAFLLKEYDAPFAAYRYFVKGGICRFGLRSRKGSAVDVCAIAKQYGGGGHKHAAGFEIRELGVRLVQS